MGVPRYPVKSPTRMAAKLHELVRYFRMCLVYDDGKAQEQEAEAEALTEDEARDADAKHSD